MIWKLLSLVILGFGVLLAQNYIPLENEYLAEEHLQLILSKEFTHIIDERRSIDLTIEISDLVGVTLWTSDGHPREYKSGNKIKYSGKVLAIDLRPLTDDVHVSIDYHTQKIIGLKQDIFDSLETLCILFGIISTISIIRERKTLYTKVSLTITFILSLTIIWLEMIDGVGLFDIFRGVVRKYLY